MADHTHVDLGAAMITMVEPSRDPARLREYNRWYEHDHAYAGVMVGPGAFSYRRFVATSALKALRAPDPSPLASPTGMGTFIACYWYLAGAVDEHFAWSFPQTAWLHEQGRMNPDREHVSTSLYDFRGARNRPGWPVPPEIALDHPYPALIATWIERAPGADLDDVVRWAHDEWAPEVLASGSPLAQALTFTPRDFPGAPGTGVGVGEHACVLWFASRDPGTEWAALGSALDDPVTRSTHATLRLRAPFVPTVPGTDTYLDGLW